MGSFLFTSEDAAYDVVDVFLEYVASAFHKNVA
jgi:hypothetical protein